MPILRPGRLKSFITATGALLLICTVYVYWAPPPASVVPSTAFEVPLVERQNAFWKVLKPILEENGPNCPSPGHTDDAGAVGFDATSTDPRPDLTTLEEEDLHTMEEAHARYIEACRTAEKLRPVHSPGTRGVVSTAGGTYFPVFLSSLRMLRRLGSTLPVEVYMKDTDEYEKQICDDILPDLGARCLVLSDVVGKNAIEHYQLKIFAVLFSSFEEVIWMDADCFPLTKPEVLLDAEPFKSAGLVTWPDFWAMTASPLYYNISRQAMPPMSARASSEAGAFLVSKKTHQMTLLLAAYYNYYGPSHYFRLLSQGAPGEGDKETFVQAATAVGEPFYAVSERVQAVGHAKPGGGISGSAMVQTDPIADHALTSAGQWRVQDPAVAPAPPAFFIHANYPKFNPGEKVFGMKWETAPTLRADGSDGRAWLVPEDTVQRFRYDVERAYWAEIRNVSCDPAISFWTWERKDEICEKVEAYWGNVFAEPHDDDPKFG
ncbi:alpha-mannosyltransferase [Aspergillus fijiensis CBS 313.89]|uniref:Nucleotide-diphospho-sugar transferase n=1 Tax=Aspergillus fijiensis CBS 313.89 TaxID=1448319 RepID=A0A8G1RU82_9EURO|nr:nucleotide-diphospho-sugar transferase [Aspergillus fijiensis CBS 313.89]RAK77950.1 nucleotide-diphospho-sugar transferase [Aspergillus fijiensis CBS 313.89]